MPKSFDRVAEVYDATRGGEERGRQYAADLHPLFGGAGTLLEVGVGTGVVALGLQELGRRVVGVDIGFEMARRARGRIGPRVALGDAERLPVRSASVNDAYSVWVLHVVDVERVLLDVARVLRPGGRYVVSQDTDPEPNPIHDIVHPMQLALGARRQLRDTIVAAADAAGLRLAHERWSEPHRFTQTPSDAVNWTETRAGSSLWDLDDERWEAIVVPTIAALRALPNPDEPIACATRAQLLVFER